MEIRETLLNILKEHGGKVDSLTDESGLVDIGLDSLDVVEVMLEIETELNIEFATEELKELKTIKDVLNLIEAKLA